MSMPDTVDVHGSACTAYSVENMLELVHQHSLDPCYKNWNLVRRVLQMVQHAAHTEDLVTPHRGSVV